MIFFLLTELRLTVFCHDRAPNWSRIDRRDSLATTSSFSAVRTVTVSRIDVALAELAILFRNLRAAAQDV
jgi:hypothetical protein